jgi:hypothetical protein
MPTMSPPPVDGSKWKCPDPPVRRSEARAERWFNNTTGFGSATAKSTSCSSR